MPKIKRALISVSDKTGILELAKGLATLHVEILSTGGTAKLLKENNIHVVEVGDYTGQPEILDGRLKTLHPKIHGGILAIRSNPRHLEELGKSGIGLIDLVVVNLYPFEETVAKELAQMRGVGGSSGFASGERIDIGGPTMIRAAAKNWQDVTVIVDPADYGPVLQELKSKGEVSGETNFWLAKKVFVLTARYDGAIANYLTGGREGRFPEVFNLQMRKVQDLRYGENPHQKAAFYKDSPSPLGGEGGGEGGGIANASQLHGKELSYNNILDLDAALGLVDEFAETASVIIKHTNPCGVAVGAQQAAPLREIFLAARECDPFSAFGGIIGFNRTVDPATAQEIARDFYECVVAPAFEAEALRILTAKKNIRLMEVGELGAPLSYDLKKVVGGLLVQERDQGVEDIRESKVVTKRRPSEEEWRALTFAWTVVKHVKSNAIVLGEGGGEGGILRTVGIGCGQMSRIDSTRIGIMKSRTPLKGAVMASDAFFPFRDCVDEAAKAGITAIIQPGGSLKDQDSITAANEHGMAMVFTGIRHFRH